MDVNTIQTAISTLGFPIVCVLLRLHSNWSVTIESEEHKMRKKYLIEENKKLKEEVEDLKRQLTYAKTQIDIKDICLMLNKEREVYHD